MEPNKDINENMDDKILSKMYLPIPEQTKKIYDVTNEWKWAQDFNADLNDETLLTTTIEAVKRRVEEKVLPKPSTETRRDQSLESNNSDSSTPTRPLSPKATIKNVADVTLGYIINDKIMIPKQNWHTMVGNVITQYYCHVCSCHLHNLYVHMNSGKHLYNLDKFCPIPAFGLSLIRTIKDMYHCAVCNASFPICNDLHINHHLSSISHLASYKLAHEEATKFFKDPKNFARNIISYAEISKKAKWEEPPDIIIKMQTRLYRFEFSSWHMMLMYENSYYCMCCSRDGIINHKYDHMYSTEHNVALSKCQFIRKYGEHLARSLSTRCNQYNHCMHCNTLFEVHSDFHLKTKSHQKQVELSILKARTVPAKCNPAQESIQHYINEVFFLIPIFCPILQWRPIYKNKKCVVYLPKNSKYGQIQQEKVLPQYNVLNNNQLPPPSEIELKPVEITDATKSSQMALKAKFPMINLDLYSKFNKKCLNTFINFNETEITFSKTTEYVFEDNQEKEFKMLEWPKFEEIGPHETEPEIIIPLVKLTPEGKNSPVVVYCPFCQVYEENYCSTVKLWETKKIKDESLTHDSVDSLYIINDTWAHCRICDILVKTTEMKKHFDPKNPIYKILGIDNEINEENDVKIPNEMTLNNNKDFCLVVDNFDENTEVRILINDTLLVTSIVAWNGIVYINGAAYCFVCELHVGNNKIYKHVTSSEHNSKLIAVKVLDQFGANMIRKVKNKCHCGLCNIMVDVNSLNDHLKWENHLFCFNEKVIESVLNTTSMPFIEPRLDFDKLKTGNEANNLDSYNFAKDPFKKDHYKAILIDENILKLRWQHWNGVFKYNGAFKCIICQCLFEDMELHINSITHLFCLNNKELVKNYEKHILCMTRNKERIHCNICNCELKITINLNEHIKNPRHKKHFNGLILDSKKLVLLDEKVFII